MKFYFNLCSLSFLSLLNLSSQHGRHTNEQFEQWKRQHGQKVFSNHVFKNVIIIGKNYKSPAEHSHRFEQYKATYAAVTQHNTESGHTFKLKLNAFADRTPQELQSMNGNRHNLDKLHHLHSDTDGTVASTQTSITPQSGQSSSNPALAIDWRQKGAVTAVENQGSCGSCWAFSAAGAIEGQVAIKQQRLMPLSKQYLLDCDTSDMACNGGWVMNAFAYVQQRGIPAESTYSSYTGSSNAASAITVSGSTPGQYLPKNEDAIASAVTNIGPISVSINADDSKFLNYGSGVYKNSACDSNANDVDHAVLIVGFNNTNQDGGPYWIVKNSWGAQWGENGYVRMAKGVNQCGIANWAMYPTLI